MKSLLSYLVLVILLVLSTSVASETLDRGSHEAIESQEPNLVQRGKHKHHLLLFMGGLKSLAALALIKIKIVLAVAVVLAIVAFTMRYLFYGGLGGLIYKSNDPLLYHEPFQHHPAPAYLPSVIHEPANSYPPVYGHSPQSSWDHQEHESYGSQWSKIGDGGRGILRIPSLTSIFGDIFNRNKLLQDIQELKGRNTWKFKNIQR